MKLIPSLITLLYLFSFHSIFAQEEVHVTGVVIDKDVNQPLEYATVAFFDKKEKKQPQSLGNCT